MKNLIRKWLFPDWTPTPVKGWVLVDKHVTLSKYQEYKKFAEPGYFLEKIDPAWLVYKVIYVFRNVDTGEIKIEEKIS